jgi:hypothetical protein
MPLRVKFFVGILLIPMKKLILTCLTLLSVFTGLRANHMLGGYMTYTHDSGAFYTVHLILYRDCYSQTPFDGTPGATVNAVVGVFKNGNQFISSYLGTDPVITRVTLNLDTSCIYPYPFCLEKGDYTFKVELPTNDPYTLIYERCCLSSSVTNVTDLINTGFIIKAGIPSANNSPVFNLAPPLFVGVNRPFLFSNWCTDADGDSLSYSLITPERGGDQSNPAPDPPVAPPFDTLVWVNGYQALQPLGNNAVFSFNDTTGTISGIPAAIGAFLVGVKVTEHRNGQVLAEYPLNFTLNVTDCNYHPDTTTGVIDVKEQGLNVYPNPFTNQLTVEGLPDGGAQLTVFDLTGKAVVPRQLVSGNKFILNWPAGLSAGAYILQVNNNLRQLLIKQ